MTAARVVSAGFNDGNIAEFYLNARKIDITGPSWRRGVNVICIDPNTQQVTSRKTYDVWGDPSQENPRLAADLNSLPYGRIVMLALKDSGMENIDDNVVKALKLCGSTIGGRLPMRQGYALIGVKGGSALAEERGGRAEVQALLPCTVRPPPALPKPPPPSQPGQGPKITQGFAPAPSWSPPAAASPPAASSFPTAPPSQPPPTQVKQPRPGGPKIQVDPKGYVSVRDDGNDANDGRLSWEEALILVEQLEQKIKAKRLANQR